MSEPVRVLIMGAAGRDFHNFNVCFRHDPAYRVVAFTAAQIPNIEGRVYPRELAGELYPHGIPIHSESELPALIRGETVDQVIFAYSDVSHVELMHKASIVLAAGADFRLLGPRATMLRSSKPVIAVCAVRTGAGKSQTARAVVGVLRDAGRRVVVVRHPMPYGDLVKQAVQRFATYEDLARHEVTIEEREEYEPHLDNGTIVYAGVDYAPILRQAEQEADVILWDGGNNDYPFYEPALHIVVADPLRAGHELSYHPGETNLRMANVVVINKVDTARTEDVERVQANARLVNPRALIIRAASPVTPEDADAIRGKRVLVVEDGPTLTHGEMTYGAGYVAAQRFGASDIVDPRPWAVGSLKQVYAKYPHIGPVLPAMGYGEAQTLELAATINAAEVDLVLIATPIDLRRLMPLTHPCQRVRYALQEIGEPTLRDVLSPFCGN